MTLSPKKWLGLGIFVIASVGVLYVFLGDRIFQREDPATDNTQFAVFLEEESPGWLLNNELDHRLNSIVVYTNASGYTSDMEVDGFVGFELEAPGYVYIFDISSGHEDSDPLLPRRDVHMVMPNAINQISYFEAGSYLLGPNYAPSGVDGYGFVQALVTPVPLEFDLPSNGNFLYMGGNPENFLEGLKLRLNEAGLVRSEWAADWSVYRLHEGTTIRGRSDRADNGAATVMNTAARCTRAKIEVPQAVDAEISFTISGNCINGAPISGTFSGPTSHTISQVLEGLVSVSIGGEAISGQSKQSTMYYGRTNRVTFGSAASGGQTASGNTDGGGDAGESSSGSSSGLDYSPVNPSIWQPIEFEVENLPPDREVDSYIWDFGDGEDVIQGDARMFYAFAEPTYSNRPYRVTSEVIFGDNEEPKTLKTQSLVEVKEGAEGLICPENSVTPTAYSDGVLFQSNATRGCTLFELPADLVNPDEVAIAGEVAFEYHFEWGALPTTANVQAYLFPIYITTDDENGTRSVEHGTRITLAHTNESSVCCHKAFFRVPANTELGLKVIMNVINNPTEGAIELNLSDLNITKNTACGNASLFTRNPVTFSERNYNEFTVDQDVSVVLRNINCGAGTVGVVTLQNGLRVYKDGLPVELITMSSTDIKKGLEKVWTWTPSTEEEPAQTGIYVVELTTTTGFYITHVTLLPNLGSEGSGASP